MDEYACMRISCPRPHAFQCTENILPSLRRAGMLLFLEFRPDIVGFTFLLYSYRSFLNNVKGTGKTIAHRTWWISMLESPKKATNLKRTRLVWCSHVIGWHKTMWSGFAERWQRIAGSSKSQTNMADECSVDGIRKQRGRYKDNSCIILILISSQQQGGKAQAEEVSTKRVDREPFPKMAPTELSACSMFRMLQRSPRYSSRPHVSLQTCQMIMRSLLNEFRKQTTLWVVISAALRKCKTKMK